MDRTADELAGVVDLFGGLTSAELETALEEVAYRADGQSVDREATAAAVEAAIEDYALIRYEPTTPPLADLEQPLLVPGPTAFPYTPDHAEDVPHILDVPVRHPDRAAVGSAAERRFRRDVEVALTAESAAGARVDGVDDTTRGSGGVAETATNGDASDRRSLEFLLDLSYDLEAWAPVDLAAERDRLETALEEG